MKKNMIKYYLLFAACFINPLQAQTSDSVDIKAMVKQQILAAQEKEKNKSNVITTSEMISVNPVITKQNIKGDSTVYIKFGVLLLASLIAAGFVIKRRMKVKKIENRLNLKKNIKAIREEQLVKEIDPRLKSIRKRLCLTSNYLNKPEKEVIFAAKKMSLAKEELLLASRLQNFRVSDKMEVTV